MTWQALDGVQVIGITGQARHGKDELAQAFLRLVPGAERFALSDAVASVARALRLMTRRDAAILQWTGTRFRAADAGTWLRCLYYAIEDRRPPLALVTGIRYQDEAEMIRQMGGHVVAVIRPDAPAITDRDPHHAVEQQIGRLIEGADVTISIEEHATPDGRTACFDRIAAGLLTDLVTRAWGR